MKIYRLSTNVSGYQYFRTRATTDDMRLRQIADDCRPQGKDWLPPTVFVYEPKLKAGDFYGIHVGGLLVVSRWAAEVLKDFFSENTELLPIYHEEKTFWLVNVIRCLNCLDREQTQWKHAKQFEDRLIRVGIEKPAFYPGLLPELGGLFKIPETCSTQILVLVRPDRPRSDDFVYTAKKNKLEGLTFEEIWSDDNLRHDTLDTDI